MKWYSKNEIINEELTESIVIQSGATVEISGTVHGDAFVLSGGELIITGDLDGSLVADDNSKVHLYGIIRKSISTVNCHLIREFGSQIDCDDNHLRMAIHESSKLSNN